MQSSFTFAVAALMLLLPSCGSDDAGGGGGGSSGAAGTGGGSGAATGGAGGTSGSASGGVAGSFGGSAGSSGSGGTAGGLGGSAGASGGGGASGGTAGSGGGASGGASGTGGVAGMKLILDDGLEYNDVNQAVSAGPWSAKSGDATITTAQAHGGSHSLRIAYAANESQSYLEFPVPGATPGKDSGASRLLVEWWEYRPANYDWAGEKFNRYFGRFANLNVTLDYPMGWTADAGANGFGSPATDGPGNVEAFGNSNHSNGKIFFSASYSNFTTQKWHQFSYYIDLGTLGNADGEIVFKADGAIVAQAKNVMLRPAKAQDNSTITVSHTLDAGWMGGWYSGNGNPNPSPAVRYIDDVKVWRD
ncbi:MAG: hypothetical protein R3B13_17840 [Polyangiaceae bacterium]